MVWYRKRGYTTNPFSVDPFATPFLVGLEELQEEVFYCIASGSMMAIEGGSGLGKTSLLYYAIHHFRGKGQVIYVDACAMDARLNIERVLKDKNGWFGRLFNAYPKNMILLLDNADQLSLVNCERIKYFYDENVIRSVVFTVENYEKAPFSESICNRINRNVFELMPLTEEYALKMIRERQHKKTIIEEDVAKILFAYCRGSPALLLEMCSLIGKNIVEMGTTNVDHQVIAQIAHEYTRDEEEKSKKRVCATCQTQLMHVRGHVRCPVCDKFCKSCGVLIRNDEYSCPKCDTLVEEHVAT